MRRVQVVFSFVSLVLATELMQSQPDPLSAIKEALAAKYNLTTTTADRTGVVSAGSALILKKNNLVTANAKAVLPLSNAYKGGKITQGLMGHMASGTAGTRTFVAGEKLWVTDIEVKNKGIVLTLFSDSYDGLHYQTSLTFPFAKGAVPSTAEAIGTVNEVFDLEPSGNETAVGRPAPAEPAARNQATPEAVATRQVPDNTPWDPKYGRLSGGDLRRIDQAMVSFDINYLRLNPAALDRRPVMQYFIALNNCSDRNVERALFNELDYPALAAYYKSKAPQILAALPRTVTDVALYRFIGGQRSGGWRLWTQSLSLGEYNTQRKAFPLKYPGKDRVEIPDSLSAETKARDLTKTCPAAVRAARAVTSSLPSTYAISLKPATYSELPMDEGEARKYIDGASQQRNVFLSMDVTILDSPPAISPSGNATSQATFRAQAARIRVIDGNTLKALGSLYDDHSLPAEAQVAQALPAPPPSPAQPANQWAFGDHMYEIRQAVYISLAADACRWPLSAEQSEHLKRFLAQVSTGSFNEKYQYNMTESRIKNAISARGRSNFCVDPMERRSFNKAAGTVAPLGPIAASKTN